VSVNELYPTSNSSLTHLFHGRKSCWLVQLRHVIPL